MTVRVGVFGAGGRMGSTVCAAVAGDPELELVAAIDPNCAGDVVEGLTIDGEPEPAFDVAVDFTVIDAARKNVEWCAANGVHAVVGTSGFGEDDFDQLRGLFTKSGCLIAPNFAIGAVLMMKFAELAAPWFETAEIIELHHDGKVDAPSGTATRTAELMAAASNEWSLDPTKKLVFEGARGGTGPGGIRIHSVRLRGIIASQEVVLGTTGQTLAIRHDTSDRSSFMPGVLLACKRVADHPGLTVGLENYLGL